MEGRAISSAVERLPYKQDVAGSKPASRIHGGGLLAGEPLAFPRSPTRDASPTTSGETA
jgi:hypothetical protein